MQTVCTCWVIPDSKVHGAKMGRTWGRQDPGGPHVGHTNLAIGDAFSQLQIISDLFLGKNALVQ